MASSITDYIPEPVPGRPAPLIFSATTMAPEHDRGERHGPRLDGKLISHLWAILGAALWKGGS
jgi:hypothetical protein